MTDISFSLLKALMNKKKHFVSQQKHLDAQNL